jgi:3',5'-cyclic AMP phosphodiesterase CpdA
MLIAQLSDPHIKSTGQLLYDRIDTAGYLERAVAHVLKLDPLPDVVVMTGDLVDGGKPEEYAHLRRLIAPLSMPVYVIPGNHDGRAALRAAFADQGYFPASGFLQYTVDDLPVRLIALDTLVEGKGYGELCAERLAWLEARLAEQTTRPALLFMHHPPFECGIDAFDHARLQ